MKITTRVSFSLSKKNKEENGQVLSFLKKNGISASNFFYIAGLQSLKQIEDDLAKMNSETKKQYILKMHQFLKSNLIEL